MTDTAGIIASASLADCGCMAGGWVSQPAVEALVAIAVLAFFGIAFATALALSDYVNRLD